MAEDKKHWYKNPNTTWNYRRKMSKWHFDTTLDDTNYEGIKMNFVRLILHIKIRFSCEKIGKKIEIHYIKIWAYL